MGSSPQEGADFLREIREGEAHISADLERALYEGHLGVRAAMLHRVLGVGLDLLIGLASCRWGCRSPEHDLEVLARRFVNACLASLRLAMAGYADEALATVRLAAEMANLLQLFDVEPTSHAEWLTLDTRRQRQQYGVAPVRLRLEKVGVQPFYDQHTYAMLSEAGVHLSPEAIWTSHAPESEKLWVGPAPSVPGLLLVWCELGYATSCMLSLGLVTQALGTDQLETVAHARRDLARAVGAGELRIHNFHHVRAWFKTHSEGRDPGPILPAV